MKFQDRLKKDDRERLWQEYCGFLELDMDAYMYIQNRLMQEQIALFCASGLGKQLLGGRTVSSVEEFRRAMPLTVYDDYANVLLTKRADMLPASPQIWLETTWEGGHRPTKLAPYTREMLDSYKHNTISIMMLATATDRGEFNVRARDRVLYGGAPLPYVTGLLPALLEEDIHLSWLPDANVNSRLTFSERIKKGFEMAYGGGLDYFFAISSVANYITESFSKKSGAIKRMRVSPMIAARYLKAKYVCRRDGVPMLPKDVFKIKGFVAAGTDAKYYKSRLERAWGIEPIEIAAGTESSCMGTETWHHDGMVFFPDACFYEFIPEDEAERGRRDPSYTPRTCLMPDVSANRNYELVITSLKGGAFARYRIGDVYRCVGTVGINNVPRFSFVDRTPDVIDIAGFTRITEASVSDVIALSRLDIGAWTARKEYDGSFNPYLHMYVEMKGDRDDCAAVGIRLLTEHLSAYFRYYDSDYDDLKKLLDMEPLKITVLKTGTVERYERATGRRLPRINASAHEISDMRRYAPDGGAEADI